MPRLTPMENLIEFDAELFWPFEPFFFANQEPTGKYPIIIQNFNYIEGCVHPVPDTNASWKGYGRHIVLEAFLEAMCTVDFVRLEDFFEDVYERAQDKKAALLRLTQCINYGLNQLKVRTPHVEWHYCYWMGLELNDLKGRADECRRWIAEKRRGKTKQIVVEGDRSLLELFDNDEKLLNKRFFDKSCELTGIDEYAPA